VIEPLRWWDIDEVLVLERTLFAPDAWSAELFWSELAMAGERHYLVDRVDGVIVAYGGVAMLGEESYLQTLGVAPLQQRGGVASRLLLVLLAAVIKAGAVQCGLEVRTDNLAAQALYRRFGFAPVGLRRGYYQPSGGDALVMIAEDVQNQRYAERLAALATRYAGRSGAVV
jgi:ribosomal-protein-alanine N-acetyltransferase